MAVKATLAPVGPEPGEVALITRASLGEETAWNELVRAYQEPVFRLAYLILGDADDAADAAQEAFIRAYLALDTYDPTRPLRPWLLRIVANQARNRNRSLGRYWQAIRRYRESRTIDDQVIPSAGETVDKQQQARSLWQAVQKLNSQGQQVLYLRYFLSLSETETAEVLEIARGTVKSRTHRALEKLRGIIENQFPDLHAAVEGITDE